MSIKSKNERLPNRVDNVRFSGAKDAVDFIVVHHGEDGGYSVDQSWGPEGEIYRAVCVWILVDIYNLTGNQQYINTARTILCRFQRRQLANGGWAISLGKDGLRFTVTDAERLDSNSQEDPVISGAMLKSIADYTLSTGSNEFENMGESAFQHIIDIWDEERGTLREKRDRDLTALRSNPDAYHFLVLQGIAAWAETGSVSAKTKLEQILSFVRETFEKFDIETMPLMIGYHVAVLSKHMPISYTKETIKPKLDEYLQAGLFASETIQGGYGHRDGLRGIVTDELHIRSAVGLAYAMKAYDYATKSNTYSSTDWYKKVTDWIDSLKADDGGYYEFQDVADGQRLGKGSPGQYLTALWIMGTTLK